MGRGSSVDMSTADWNERVPGREERMTIASKESEHNTSTYDLLHTCRNCPSAMVSNTVSLTLKQKCFSEEHLPPRCKDGACDERSNTCELPSLPRQKVGGF